jgi:hypothetical protein
MCSDMLLYVLNSAALSLGNFSSTGAALSSIFFFASRASSRAALGSRILASFSQGSVAREAPMLLSTLRSDMMTGKNWEWGVQVKFRRPVALRCQYPIYLLNTTYRGIGRTDRTVSSMPHCSPNMLACSINAQSIHSITREKVNTYKLDTQSLGFFERAQLK